MDQFGLEKDTQQKILLIFLQRQMEAGKWLLASLLVVNGGAVIAILSNENLVKIDIKYSISLFILGVGLAFISGALSWALSDSITTDLRVLLDVKMTRVERLSEDLPSERAFVFLILSMWAASTLSLFSFMAGCFLAISNFDQAALSKSNAPQISAKSKATK